MVNRFRIARTPRGRYTPLPHKDAPVIDMAAAILPVLRRELPPAWGTLLAEPRRRDDDIDWWAEGLGNAVPLTALPAHEQGKLRAVLDERLEHLRALAGRLRAGDPALADALLLAGRYPGPECIHTIAGQPVLIFWGHAEAGAAVLPAGTARVDIPVSAGRSPAAPAPPAPPAAPSAPSAPASGRPDGGAAGASAGMGAGTGVGAGLSAGLSWRAGVGIGLALFFLLLFAGTLAWWLRLWPFVGAYGFGDALQARLEREEGRGSALEAEVAALERQVDDARKVCRAPDPPQPPPTRAEPPKAEVPKAEPPPPPLAEVPAEPPKPEPPVAALPLPVEPPRAIEAPTPRPKPPVPAEIPRETPAAVPAEPAREAPPPQARACPAPRQPWEAPEVVFALDASGSMSFPYSLSDQEEASILAGLRRGDPSAVARAQAIYGTRAGDRRIDHAKSAMNTAIDRLPGDVDAGLVVFGECRSTDNFNFFKPGERGRLKGVVQGIQPGQGTPLARGIERAANMMDAGDPKRPAVIVVLSDGHDSCGGDPCATARALKQRKPGLVINVVQVTNGDSASCLARETGGKVFNAKEAGGVLPAVQKATGQAPVPAECRNR